MVANLAKTAPANTTGAISKPQPQSAITAVKAQRSITEVQAAIAIAKQFPRDEGEAREKILNACARSSLAERGVYLYKRGESDVTGLTIHVAKEIARIWGNIEYGWTIVDEKIDSTTVETCARDLESNIRSYIEFTVSHRRVTKKGSYLVSDPRDLYEMVANMAARRMRACILGLIPNDIQDDAHEQCDRTMKDSVEITPKTIKALVSAFEELKVTKKQLEKRIQRKIESVQPGQVVQLRKIFNSMKEGMSDASSWFEEEAPTAAASAAIVTKGVAGLKGKLANIQSAKKEVEVDTEQALAEVEIEATGEVVTDETAENENYDDIPEFAEDEPT
jgi:hypothetical protein